MNELCPSPTLGFKTNVPHGGERNRALTIVKSRGTQHSNQVRELLLSNDGVTLADVYTAGGKVLMGTARFEKELEDQQKRQQKRTEAKRKRIALELSEEEIQAKLKSLERELQIKREELAWLDENQKMDEQILQKRKENLANRRQTDANEHR